VLGWKPEVGFEQLVQTMVDHDLCEQKQLEGR
jgi:GDP-D-mannose dehydratase